MKLLRRDVLCQCAGGGGAVASCAGMIVSLAAGLLGAAGSTLAQTGGMTGMGDMAGPAPAQGTLPAVLNLLSRIAVPLLLGSILLMLVGVARAGWRAVGFVAAGSALLLATMIPTSTMVVAWLLGGGYLLVLLGYVVAWKGNRKASQMFTLPGRADV